MKTKLTSNGRAALLPLLTILIAQPLAGFAQGSLTPPGPPAPMMKTLQQVEPRTDVLTLPPAANAQYVISAPGSYYLTTNILGISGANKVGILIRTNNVTLDLNGFAMIGNGSLFSGIWLYGPSGVGATNVAVVNGTVSGWGIAGVYASGSKNCRFERLLLSDNAHEGLYRPSDSQVLHCLARGNGTFGLFAGINVGSQCYVFDNSCIANTEGIVAEGNHNRIDSNHLADNGSGGISHGIIVSQNQYNLVVRNLATSEYSFSNYSLPSGNTWGPILFLGGGAITGATYSTGWENFDLYNP